MAEEEVRDNVGIFKRADADEDLLKSLPVLVGLEEEFRVDILLSCLPSIEDDDLLVLRLEAEWLVFKLGTSFLTTIRESSDDES